MASVPRNQEELPQRGNSPIELHQTSHRASMRQSFRREPSWNSPYNEHQPYHGVPPEHDLAESRVGDERIARGLGLENIPEETNRIRRVPVGSRDSLRRSSPSTEPVVASEPRDERGVFSQASTAYNTPLNRPDRHNGNAGWPSPHGAQHMINDPGYKHISSDVALLDPSSPEHQCECPTHGDVLKTRMDWFTTTILTLAVYSTVFSAVFLGIAIAQPRWGHKIGTSGSLSYSSATLLSALFSKTVELSFATVFVATLGQVLSRRAFVSETSSKIRDRGISIAQMNLRLWIMQPGTLITNWIGVKYALPTVLGSLTLLATISAIFYTTAAEGLVAPKLKLGKYELMDLSGKVSASYANSIYLSKNCQTPIPASVEPDDAYRGETCLQITHAGQGFHNFDSWMIQWAQKIQNAETKPGDARVAPVATWHYNTEVSGQFITPSGENITADSQKWGRLVQNVTMAMPHANIINAARDPINKIIQPEDLRGSGEYIVRAAIPAPAMNVLCVGLSTTELAPMLVNNGTKSVPKRRFTTAIDDIFGWMPEGNGTGEVAPWFAKAPIDYNTVGNFTDIWGQSGIYIVAKPPPGLSSNDYVLCGLRSSQYPDCTTKYHVAESGGNLTVHCDADPENVLPYSKYVPKAPVGQLEKNWKDIGAVWVRAVALTHGLSDGNSSMARMLVQMTPSYNSQTFSKLKAGLPSYGEGLSVLAGCTLLDSSSNAPFKHEWTFSEDYFYLQQPQYEGFQAEVAYTDYASGGSQNYQSMFYLILVSTFLLNCWCLGYLIWNFWRYGHVTDYTEPQNLFALAINSPPSNILAGACGGGPNGIMLRKKWCVDMSRPRSMTPGLHSHGEETAMTSGSMHPHFYVRYSHEKHNLATPQPYTTPHLDPSSWPDTQADPTQPSRFSGIQLYNNATASVRNALSRSKTRLWRNSGRTGPTEIGRFAKVSSMDDLHVEESPAVQQYKRLTRS